MNTAAAEMAHLPGPADSKDFAEYWLERLRDLRHTRVGIPADEDVRRGLRTRKAYGGSATRSSLALLWALERQDQAPALDQLTIEHVMPQKLTDDWKRNLGSNADEFHAHHRDKLPNLTLSGDATNTRMAAKTFDVKRKDYKESSIAMTRRLAKEPKWDEKALERRAGDLADRILRRWPWVEPNDDTPRTPLRWRISGEAWHDEHAASQMVLNVAAALLSRDSENARRLSGKALSSNLHRAGTTSSTLTLRAVPSHPEYVLYPYERDYRTSAERCRKMGRRCNVTVDVQFSIDDTYRKFWRFFKTHTGGVPGWKDTWRGRSQWTIALNASGDRVAFYIGYPDLLRLHIRAGEPQASEPRAARMRGYSRVIREHMEDQEIGGNVEQRCNDGTTLWIERRWTRDDETEWPDAAEWIKDQYERLRTIIADPHHERNS